MTPLPTLAALKATLALAQELAAQATPSREWPLVTRLIGAPVPAGFAAWRVGPDDGPIVALPTVADHAPLAFRRRYLARVVATALGRCLLCGEVASLDREPPAPGEPGRATFEALPLYVRVRHSAECPAGDFDEDDRQWILPPVGTAQEVAP